MRAYVVFCHPTHRSFTGAALERVLAGLRAGGHEVRVSDLYADGFRPELSVAEHRHQHVDFDARSGAEPDLRDGLGEYVDHLRWCEALVMVHPTWWSGQPAMLKGFFDRVLVQGVAFDLPAGADRIRPRLGNIRRLVVVTSHGSPKHTNMVQGESGKRIVGRAIRVLCGLRCRTRWIALYDIDRADETARARFLDRVEQRLRRL